jgi:hypothetical protein
VIQNIRRMNKRVKQTPYSVDKDMTFLILDLLSCIEASRIERNSLSSALLTPGLSITAAVGLVSLPSRSRQNAQSG